VGALREHSPRDPPWFPVFLTLQGSLSGSHTADPLERLCSVPCSAPVRAFFGLLAPPRSTRPSVFLRHILAFSPPPFSSAPHDCFLRISPGSPCECFLLVASATTPRSFFWPFPPPVFLTDYGSVSQRPLFFPSFPPLPPPGVGVFSPVGRTGGFHRCVRDHALFCLLWSRPLFFPYLLSPPPHQL